MFVWEVHAMYLQGDGRLQRCRVLSGPCLIVRLDLAAARAKKTCTLHRTRGYGITGADESFLDPCSLWQPRFLLHLARIRQNPHDEWPAKGAKSRGMQS